MGETSLLRVEKNRFINILYFHAGTSILFGRHNSFVNFCYICDSYAINFNYGFLWGTIYCTAIYICTNYKYKQIYLLLSIFPAKFPMFYCLYVRMILHNHYKNNMASLVLPKHCFFSETTTICLWMLSTIKQFLSFL